MLDRRETAHSGAYKRWLEGSAGRIESNMAEQPDYATISPPEDKPETEYSWRERRAELYRLLKQYGHPRNIEMNQSELGDRYGCDQSRISKDFQKLREYFKKRSGSRAVAETGMLGEKVVEQIIEQARELEDTADDLEAAGDFRSAAKMRERAAKLWSEAQDNQMQFNNFLFDTGQLDEEPDQLEIDMDASDAYMQALKQKHQSDDEGRFE